MPHTTFAAPVAALLLTVFWKSLPVFALAGLAAFALRRASAAARHALWLLTLAALLCLPLFCALLPRWAAPVLPAAPRPANHLLQTDRPALPREPARIVATPTVVPAPQAATVSEVPNAPVMADVAPLPMPAVPKSPLRASLPVRPALSPADGVCLAWLIGVLLVTGRTLLGLAAASRLTRRCRPVTAGPLVEAAEDARRALGLRLPVAVRVGPVIVPMTCGVARPVVLLPDAATDWPEGRLRAVLLHEAAHVARLDWATMLLARCVCALYWPHPLAWLVTHRLRAEAEGACDDLVLTHGGIPAPDYAAHLLEIVRALSARRISSATTVAMASRPEVSARLRTILDTRRRRGGVTRHGLALAVLVALGAVAAMAAVHPVARKTLAAAPTVGAARTALLPGGARVDLVGVDAYSPVTKRTVELTPDGTARTGSLHPGWQFLRGAFASLPKSEGVKGSYDYFIVQADTTASYDVGSTHIVPRGDGRGDVSITAATGSYGKLLVAPLGRTIHRVLPGGGTLTLSVNANVPRFADWTGRHYAVTQVTVTAPTGYLDNPGYVLLPSLADGHPATAPVDRYDSDHDTPRRYTCYFRTSALQAKHVRGFQFLWRPVHTLVFRDVALRPAVETAPATSSPQTESPEKAAADQQASEANLRQIGQGLIEYAQEHYTHFQPHFPDAARWMDEIIPYLVPRQITGAARQQRIAALFHDPAAPAGQTWSYAYNRALSGLSLGKMDSPATTVAVFESTKGTRNASDGGQSVPKPGWHSGGSDYLFTDGHAKWLGSGTATALFSPVDPNKPVAIPVMGRVYDRKTLKPVTDSSVIFSQSSQTITRGSVWPSSFTHSTGRFQSVLYPGKNYLMVLEGGRYIPISRQPMLYESSGGTARVTVIGSAAHQYVINLSLPNAYALAGESHPDKAAGVDVMAFVPVSRATLKPVTGAAPTTSTSVPALPTAPPPSPAPQPAAQVRPDDQARFLAGLTAVQGPGVVVTLNDSKKPVPASMHVPGMAPPNLIHDTDINVVVNELKAAGAEAIAVNGERLVAVSPIRSAGTTVLVNSTTLTPPYTVRAIGDPARLQAALSLPGGLADQLRAFDPAMIRVQTSARLTLPAYRGGVPARYARPVAAASAPRGGLTPEAAPAPSANKGLAVIGRPAPSLRLTSASHAKAKDVPTVAFVTIDRVDIASAGVERISAGVAPGDDHDARLLAALGRHGATDIREPTVGALDGRTATAYMDPHTSLLPLTGTNGPQTTSRKFTEQVTPHIAAGVITLDLKILPPSLVAPGTVAAVPAWAETFASGWRHTFRDGQMVLSARNSQEGDMQCHLVFVTVALGPWPFGTLRWPPLHSRDLPTPAPSAPPRRDGSPASPSFPVDLTQLLPSLPSATRPGAGGGLSSASGPHTLIVSPPSGKQFSGLVVTPPELRGPGR